MPSFVPLHVHSNYSPLDGVAPLEALCAAARRQGAVALALTDTNGLYGAVRFVEIARAHGLQPLLGAEVVHGAHRAVLVVKTPEGYANLCRLLSARHSDRDFELARAISRYRQGVVVLSDDERLLLACQRQRVPDLYVELTPGPRMHEAVELSRRHRLPPVVTTRARWVHPEEYALHRVLRAIALNTTWSALPADACATPYQWLMPPDMVARHCAHVPQALANTGRIAAACHTDWAFPATILPTFRRLSDAEADARLRATTYAGAHRRYQPLTDEVRERIEAELAVIGEKGYAPYLLITEEIARQAPRSCGRGSAAASVVAYCLGITNVDPIRHRLMFERFLNRSRPDPPDIDLDFPWDERDRLLEWVFAAYGTARVAMVGTHVTLSRWAAIRGVARVYGLPSSEITRAGARLRRELELAAGATCSSLHGWAHNLCRRVHLSDPWPEVLATAIRLEGCLQYRGVHCGGVVIVPDELRRYVPVEVAAKGVPVVQWDKDQVEDAGLVKLDLLGNRSLSVIRDTLAAVARHTGRSIDEATWRPEDDPATIRLLQRGETIGCFYIESPATRLLLKKLWTGMPPARRAHADPFAYLVMVSSLIRPAANRDIREFVRRAHGHPAPSLHPCLDDVLGDTHGIMVYQEDVSRVVMALAGLTLEEADDLRRILSKKHKHRQLADYRARFDRGTAALGVPRSVACTVWNMIQSFTGYSFCKPHSASYAQISCQAAYLRAHYPAEFMAAVISNQGGYYSTFAYLSEARRMGLIIQPPDINASDWPYTGQGRTIRMGFMQIKGLEERAVRRWLDERAARGPYRSFEEFLVRTQPDPAQVRLVVKAGGFDSVAGDMTRPGLLWRLAAWRHAQADRASRAVSPGLRQLRFGEVLQRPRRGLPIPESYSRLQAIRDEIELYGFPLACHPLDLFAEELRPYPAIPACELARYVGKRVCMVGWLISEKSAMTRDGEPMEFVSLEDRTGLYDATVFPAVYRRYGHLLRSDRPLVLEGNVEEEFQVPTVTVHRITCIGHASRADTSVRSKPDLEQTLAGGGTGSARIPRDDEISEWKRWTSKGKRGLTGSDGGS